MRKKRYENITLFGKSFRLDTKETIGYTPLNMRDIYDVYARPSSAKVSIWKDWENWFRENDGWCTVRSFNCNFFSIEGYVRDVETRKMYFCVITHTNHWCIEVEA